MSGRVRRDLARRRWGPARGVRLARSAVARGVRLARAALALAAAVGLWAACRGEPRRSLSEADLARLVDSLRPAVERAAGFQFKATPRSALRSREQVRAYLVRKLREELPPARIRGIESAYRLLRLLPDTVRLEPLLIDLYSEQVAGYYDPDSTTLFGVAGTDPAQLRLILAHEMVHALQGQYLPLDSILRDVSSNDRSTAAQAVLEGQATLVSIQVLSPGQDITEQPEFWSAYRAELAQQQGAMPVLARAPLLIRETLIFPYLEGAEFMRWWRRSPLADSLPFGRLMPSSTEQILHPERYLRGDRPVPLRIVSKLPSSYSDGLGEEEIRVLDAVLHDRTDLGPRDQALGWGGDRYAVYDAEPGPALVWYSVWDDARAADRFVEGIGRRLVPRSRPGYRTTAERLAVSGRPGARVVIAPDSWAGWRDLPRAEIAAPSRAGSPSRPERL